jgi:hypothetical protein
MDDKENGDTIADNGSHGKSREELLAEWMASKQKRTNYPPPPQSSERKRSLMMASTPLITDRTQSRRPDATLSSMKKSVASAVAAPHTTALIRSKRLTGVTEQSTTMMTPLNFELSTTVAQSTTTTDNNAAAEPWKQSTLPLDERLRLWREHHRKAAAATATATATAAAAAAALTMNTTPRRSQQSTNIGSTRKHQTTQTRQTTSATSAPLSAHAMEAMREEIERIQV